MYLLQVVWDPAVSLLVYLWSDQPVRDQRGCRAPIHWVCWCHDVRHLQHHFAGGAPQHAHRHDEQLLSAHCCEHRLNILQNMKPVRSRIDWRVFRMCPNLDFRITQILSGSLLGQSCGWATLKKGPLCLHRLTSSPVPNLSCTSCVGLRSKCARGPLWTPSALKALALSA